MKMNSKALSKQALDLIFTKVQATRVTTRDFGGNKIDFRQFLEVLDLLLPHSDCPHSPKGFLASLREDAADGYSNDISLLSFERP